MTRVTSTIVLLASLVSGCGASAAARTSTSAPTGPAAEPSAEAFAPDDAAIEVSGPLLPPMPTAVTSFGAAADPTHLYALGGYAGAPHEYSREGQSRSLWRLPLDGRGAWEEISRLDAGLQGVALVEHEGTICRFGGNRILNAAGEPERMRSLVEAACFDPRTRRWTSLPELPAGRSSHDAAIVGTNAYVVGGWRLDGEASDAEWAGTLVALDLAADDARWRSVETPFRRRALGAAAAGERLVVVGGITPEGEISSRVDVYDPRSGVWSRGPDFPTNAFGVAAAGIGDDVYASSKDGVVYRWRIGEQAWVAAAELAFGRFFHRLVAAGPGALIALGGIDGMHTHGRTRHVERVDLDGNGPVVSTWTMAYPGAAKNRQALFVHGDFLYLFGGNNSLEQHDFEPENFVAEGWRLHLPSMRWERVADYPAARQTMQTLSHGERGIAVGGFGHDGAAAVSHTDAYVFDFERERWAPRAGLPRSLTQFGLVEHQGRLWVFGGLNYDPAREGNAAFDHVTAVLTASLDDPDEPFVVSDVVLPGPRRAFAGAVLDGHYYLVGGMRHEFEPVDDCLAFELGTRAFSDLPCPSATRISADLVALGDRLYLAGGSIPEAQGLDAARSIEVLDPVRKSWSVLVEELPFDTRHMRMLAYRDRLLLVSTHLPEARIRIAIVDPGHR